MATQIAGMGKEADLAGKGARPHVIAAMVRMLCGPGARYITGQAIHVDGGGYMA